MTDHLQNSHKIKVAIAGASGFIGSHLIEKIKSRFDLICFSRSKKKSSDIKWVETDLFSYSSVLHALEGANVAVYLVHSMLPSTRLFQGNFQDTDLFIADNFARACVHHKVKQIIYLGGLVPEVGISKHLESRKEVEEVFKSTGIPTTILRAGMVVGDGGSSFEILRNLVHNLPVMVLPKWTGSHTQTIFIDDLVDVLSEAILNEQFFDKTLDVVNGENITYEDLIRITAKHFNKSNLTLSVPINSTSFSKLWVTLFGDSSYELVSPLIDSLKCDLPTPKIPIEIESLIKYRNYSEMLKQITHVKGKKSLVRTKKLIECNTVRSIQRLGSSKEIQVKNISDLYTKWLPTHLKNLIRVNVEEDKVIFYPAILDIPLLILQRQREYADLNRIKFHIIGGILTKTKNTGWLEFRKVSGGDFILASINEFVPSLPWYIYKYSQAIIHLKVMKDFSHFLENYNFSREGRK
ncbi:MAG: NAD(P)H-binding protein [Bacteriovoracaceae bacterium]